MGKQATRMITRCIILIVVVGVIFFWPLWASGVALVYLVCGVYDFCRNGSFDKALARKYFIGSGRNTWAFAPFNAFLDLLCRANRHVYQLHDLPAECALEIREVIAVSLAHKHDIISYLHGRMGGKKRGMLFFQWYGRNINVGLNIPPLQRRFKYIKTVGVSVFNENQSTSFHFGPLRMMFRVLYNLSPPTNSPGVYIQVKQHRHYWHDNPLFIFDDTLVHASFNQGGAKRYCLFIDILRPSYARRLLNAIVMVFSGLTLSMRRLFYKNWKPIE